MKLVQITDLHMVEPGKSLHGLDPCARLTACIDDVLESHADAAACVLTGDLVHAGQIEAYAALRQQLERLPMPWFALMGNHDRRLVFRKVFADALCDESGFVQGCFDTALGRLLMLDTLDEGHNAGFYCDTRKAWLAAQLKEAHDLPVYLFMHHPPFDIGIPSLDVMKLAEPKSFAQLIASHKNIRHLFFGHVHRPVCGSWHGFPYSASRGLNHQVPFDLSTLAPVPKSHEPPAYSVIFLTEDQVTVHFHDFLDHSVLPANMVVKERP